MLAAVSVRSLYLQRRRYALILAAISLGFALVVLMSSVSRSMQDALKDKASLYFAGHVSVVGYRGAAVGISDPGRIIAAVRSAGITPRGISGRSVYYHTDAELFFGGESVRQRRMIGVDFGAEGEEFSRLSYASGGWEEMGGGGGILISESAARTTGARVGDDVTVFATTDAGQYTAMLKAAYAAIKAEDPTATVLLGGLATGTDTSFLAGIRDNGGWGSFDVLAIHTYVAGTPDGSAMESWIASAKSVVASYGSKPIWITEFGWATYSGTYGVSTAQQKSYIMRAYEIARGSGVAGAFVFELVNHGTSSTIQNYNYGLAYRDLSLKPSYAGYACEARAIYLGELPGCNTGTFHEVTPTRVLDTRTPLGLSGTFVSGTPRTFKVAGNLGGSPGSALSAEQHNGNLSPQLIFCELQGASGSRRI